MNDTVISVIITLAFADATDRRITFNGIDPEYDLLDAKAKVLALNANMPAAFKTTFVSANGAECVMISKLQSVETTEEVIYYAS